MKVYVAGRVHDIERVQSIQRRLTEIGAEITYDWTTEEVKPPRGWGAEPKKANRIAAAEIRGVLDADYLVFLGNGVEHGGIGCYIEVGLALGAGIPVCVIGETRNSVFWYLPGVFRVESVNDAIKELGL